MKEFTKRILFFAFICSPLVFLILGVFYLEIFASKGKEVILQIKRYDTTSLLSDSYILYQIDWENTNCQQFKNNICPQKDFLSFSPTYQKNIDAYRFDLPTEEAKKLDIILNKTLSDEEYFIEVIYIYEKGVLKQKELLINNLPLESFLKKF